MDELTESYWNITGIDIQYFSCLTKLRVKSKKKGEKREEKVGNELGALTDIVDGRVDWIVLENENRHQQNHKLSGAVGEGNPVTENLLLLHVQEVLTNSM